MPNIKEFDSPIDSLHPSDQGVQANVQAARRIGSILHQEGDSIGGGISEAGTQYEGEVTRQQITHGLAGQAQTWSSLTDSWNAAAKGPNAMDPTLAQNWRQSVLEPALQAYQQGFSTKEGQTWAAEQAAHMRQHFTETTTADAGTLAGMSSLTDLQTSADHFQTAAYNDPASLDTILGALDKGFRAAVGAHTQLTAEDAARVTGQPLQTAKAAVVQSAFRGMIESGPAGIAEARRLLGSGKYGEYIGDPAPMLDRATEVENRNASMQRQATELQRQQLTDQGKAVYADWVARAGPIVRAGGILPPEMVHEADAFAHAPYSAYVTGEVTNMQSMLNASITDASSRRYQTTDPRTGDTLRTGLNLPQGDPRRPDVGKVDAAFNNGRLSVDDWHQLREQAGRTPDPALEQSTRTLDRFLNTAIRPQLTRTPALNADGSPNWMGGKPDIQGDVAYAEAQREAHAMFQALIAQGQTPAQALDALTKPDSPLLHGHLQYWQTGAASGDAATFFGHNPNGLPQISGTVGNVPSDTPATGNPDAPPPPPPPNGAVTGRVVAPGPMIGQPIAANDPDLARVQQNPIRPGESWTSYQKRVGLH